MNDDPLFGGRYRLGDLLGVGGSASVFAVDDTRAAVDDPTRLAIKVLHPHLCADDASREAFLHEARQVQRLRHPNVVGVHDSGLHDGGGVIMPWIVLDRLDGPTLREWVEENGPLAPRAAAAVFDGILAGLAAAHAEGIVHRDISPQNIVLTGIASGDAVGDATPRIVDFGLADATGRSTVGDDVLLSRTRGAGSSVAASGSVVGNARFMSPEQAQGLPVRSVSDLYQVGAVLSYALTGSVPFPRATTEQTLRAHVSAPPPVPSALVPAARPFDRVVTRAMSKTPAHRFRSAADFRSAVGEVDAVLAITVVPDPVAADDEHVGVTATTVLPSAGVPLGYLSSESVPPEDAAAGSGRRGSSAGIVAVAVGVVIVGLAGWGVLSAAASGAGPVAAPTPTISETPSAEPSPVASSAAPTAPIPAPPTPTASAVSLVPVPLIAGTLADADRTLRAAGLAPGTVRRIESADAADHILGQSPAPGTAVPSGQVVDLTVASGSNVVPQVAGMTIASAVAHLQSSGFSATTDRAAPTATSVLGTQPAAGTVLRVGVSLTLVLAPAPTPSASPDTGGGPPR